MRKAKILILTNVRQFLLDELIIEIKNHNCTVDVVHVEDASLLPDVFELRKNGLARLMVASLKLVLLFIKRGRYDVCNVHYPGWFLGKMFPLLAFVAKKVVVSFWGSDYYKQDLEAVNITKALARADLITFTNNDTKCAFESQYRLYNTAIVKFGLRVLDHIDQVTVEDIHAFKARNGIDPNRIMVMCGTNSSKSQQYEKMIDSIDKMNDAVKDKCIFVFPLTYGDLHYREQIVATLAEHGFKAVVLREPVTGKALATLRKATDILIQVQVTDQQSGAMMETLYAGGIVITGEWLPYSEVDEKGVFWFKVPDVTQVGNRLSNIVENIAEVRKEIEQVDNRRKLGDSGKWSFLIKAWMKAYSVDFSDNSSR